MSDDTPLAVLIGRQLSAVCFVQDYVQFQFDGYWLTALADPILVREHRKMFRQEPSYRDTLCDQIREIVIATEDNGVQLSVAFSNGATLIVPLDGNSTPGPEMAHLSGFNAMLNVWFRNEA